MSSTDIGLDKTLSNTLGTHTIKANVEVIKKNTNTAISVSSTSSDTGLYAAIEDKNDFVKINLGVEGKDASITKSSSVASGDTHDIWTVEYDGESFTKYAGQKITLNMYTIYIGSVYLDSDTAIITSGQLFDLGFAKIPHDTTGHELSEKFSSNSEIHTR